MMAEPTLGARIMEAADHLADRTMDCDDGGIADANDTLRALAARADAAERLAVARIRWNDMSTTNSPAALWDALIEVQGSEAAWRAINGDVQP